MNRLRTRTAGRVCFAVAVLAWLVPPVLGLDSSGPARPIGPQSQQDQWEQGLAALSSGRFDQADALIGEVAARVPVDGRVRHVADWLADFEQLRSDRATRIRQDYDKYVDWVREETEKKLWRQASWSCALAFHNADDQEAFRHEPWLRAAVEGAKTRAAEYEKDGKWFKAASIYVRLNELFPHDESYREALDKCQDHIRLELAYDPESDWEAAVSNIVPAMARDGFRKIEEAYLEEPDMKRATIGGLKQVLRLVREADLSKVFKELKDADAVEEFCTRVGQRLRYAEASDELTVDDLIAYFDRVLRINEEVELLPREVLVHEFVHGALQPLDRFSDMIWPADVQEFNKHTQGHFSGVGIQIRKTAGDPILVVSPLKDSPAYRKGVRPGDLITKINGKSANKYTITGAVREITGPVGTTVRLTFKRDDREFDLELEREEIVIETIKGFERDEDGNWKYMIDPDQRIGYVRVANFTEGTTEELKAVLEDLHKREKMRGLVLDLRDNPGGPLRAAVEVADLFLDGNKRIVSTKGRFDEPWVKTTTKDEQLNDYPMVVLMSRYSASASEIVTGALQVHNRALLVGERTYGKGSVQQVLPLNNTRLAFLKLTTALYYLPNGRCLHKSDDSKTWGVDPDVEVRLVPKERIKINEMRLKADILKGKDQDQLTEDDLKSVTEYRRTTQPAEGDEDAPGVDEDEGTESAVDESLEHPDADNEDEEDDEELIERSDPNEFPEIDPQLETALMLMRVRLESDQPWRPDRPEIAAMPATGTDG